VLTDPDVLVNGAEPTEDCIVVYDDVAPEGRIVYHDHVVGDLTVVSDVGTDHEQAIVADAGDHPAPFGPGVHCHILADGVVAPDHEGRFLAAILQILRLKPDRGERENASPLTHRCEALDYHVRAKCDPGGERNVLADDAVGPDHDVPR
jgi:hypothetical protein